MNATKTIISTIFLVIFTATTFAVDEVPALYNSIRILITAHGKTGVLVLLITGWYILPIIPGYLLSTVPTGP